MRPAAERLGRSGVVGILRHLSPARAHQVGEALLAAGVMAAEVPLNDERPALQSIRLLADAFGDKMLIGAGTVTDPAQVARVRDAGGCFIVSPDANPHVITASIDAGLVSCPGFMTPSEAFAALRSGADMLKLFPASLHRPPGLVALRSVLPAETNILAVGGVAVSDAEEWRRAGAAGLGIGSALFRPDYSGDEIRRRATAFTAAWDMGVVDEQPGEPTA